MNTIINTSFAIRFGDNDDDNGFGFDGDDDDDDVDGDDGGDDEHDDNVQQDINIEDSRTFVYLVVLLFMSFFSGPDFCCCNCFR